MATQLQLRRGTASENDNFTGATGELTYDTTNSTLRLHDGSTQGGFLIQTDTTGLNISEDGTTIVSNPPDINFATGFNVVDDGDGTATVNVPHVNSTSNPHSVTATQVGLGNVPNEDATDPVNWDYSLTGIDTTVVTGTAGTSGNLVEWNADGDAVDSGSSTGDFLTSVSISTLTDAALPNTTAAGQLLIWNATNGQFENATLTGGTNTTITEGDSSITIDVADTGVLGPSNSTDTALPRFDGTNGDALLDSGIIVDADDNLSGHGQGISFKTADFTLSSSEAGKNLDIATGAAATITVPANSNVSLPVGYSIGIVQADGNAVTVSGETGVTINSKNGNTNTNGQWSAATLYKRNTDEWVLIGDLA